MIDASIEEISSNLFLTTEAMTRASSRNVSKRDPFQVVQEEPFIFSSASMTEKHVNFAFLLITHDGICIHKIEWKFVCMQVSGCIVLVQPSKRAIFFLFF